MSEHKEIDAAAMNARLLKMKAALEAMIREHGHDSDVVELDQTTQGRLSRMDAMQVQAMAREVARRRAAELKRIDAALKRVADGDYGYCVSCDEEIQPKRLDFDPSVPNCINCARDGEA